MADAIKATLCENTKLFDKIGDKIPPLQDGAKQLGVNSGLFVAIALFIVSFFTLLFHGVELAITGYTIVYPGIMSVRAIESKGADDDKKWLTYWMVLGFLEFAETFLSFFFYFIPYWWLFRVVLFVWLISFNGAEMVSAFLIKHLKANRKQVEEFVNAVDSCVASTINNAQAEMSNPNNLMKAAGMMSQAQNLVKQE